MFVTLIINVNSFASLESTDVENEIDEEEDPESNQTGKNCVIFKKGMNFNVYFNVIFCILFIYL